MTTAAAAAPALAPHPLAEAIRKAVADTFSRKFGSSWNVAITAQENLSSADTTQVFVGIAASGGLQGPAAIRISHLDAIKLARNFNEEQDASSALSDEQKKTIEIFWQEVSAAASVILEPEFGKVVLQANLVDPPNWQGAGIALGASDSGSRALTLYLQISDELAKNASPSAEAAIDQPADANTKAATIPENLDLLMGVDLSLTLRFGTRTLTLREILDLNSGSVVELDRQVQEPADLLLGDKLIARGEVVIVDGNYGLRITELPDQTQPAAKRVNV
ncbi:MAG TPA: flagellar motor switch protein FliN [Terriglobales bacterium]|nr:flagellar motor switch protein FliN [Terriglobales bacterium]